MRTQTYVIIAVGLLSGAVFSLVSQLVPQQYSTPRILLLNIGCGLIATAFISIVIDLFWSRERASNDRKALEPFLVEFRSFADHLRKLEWRFEAFKKLGLNRCHSSRDAGLANFLPYASEFVDRDLDAVNDDGDDRFFYPHKTVNIVSSSARGLMGHLDRHPSEVQASWRDLIVSHPKLFRMLLTHPAYAHLRQPAEERGPGEIELEILKSSIFIHCVAGMRSEGLRFYRGSPTVFMIQADRHILLNPYPYGKMAMDTLSLEFESENDKSYVADFVRMHFTHMWEFHDQPDRCVDGRALVQGIDVFEDILLAFSECTLLSDPNRLRLTAKQVRGLDAFIEVTLRRNYSRFENDVSAESPFMSFVQQKGLSFATSDYADDDSEGAPLRTSDDRR